MEPAFTTKANVLDEFLAVADIVKFSREAPVSEQIRSIPDNVTVIETMGSEGLQCRHEGIEQRCEAIKVEHPIDTSGAGDWCTAGIIHGLLSSDVGVDGRFTSKQMFEAIDVGRYCGAFACTFLGTTSRLPAALPLFSSSFSSGLKARQGPSNLSDYSNTDFGPFLHCLSCGALTHAPNSQPWKP